MSHSKLTSDQIKSAKEQLERHILDDVREFEELTGTKVDSILACDEYSLVGGATGKTEKIKVTAKL